MSQKKRNTNSDGEYWHPGMNWFKPQLTACQNSGCQCSFYKKAHTRRKYCDDCQVLLEQERQDKRLAKLRERHGNGSA
jgi:hypothetical protein